MRKNGNKKLHERYWDFTVEYGKMVKETAEFIVDEYKKCEDDNCDLDELVSNEVDDSLIYYSSQWTILEENATPDECGEAYQQALEAYWDDVYEEVQAQIDEMDESYKPIRRTRAVRESARVRRPHKAFRR